uniref:Uncharacterized protein n=1 Tax=Arundo donax TaxID=35708 RepID=A0A0A8ZD37_ARUDO
MQLCLAASPPPEHDRTKGPTA